MAFMVDVEEVKAGLIIFRRTDVRHTNWYCRIKLPNVDRYKTVSLKTAERSTARDKALEHDAELKFRLKHDVPVFSRLFCQIAKDYCEFQEARAAAGLITQRRAKVTASHITAQLNRYIGNIQITLIGQDRWIEYPLWRQKNGRGRDGKMLVSDSTIRSEMATLRAVMAYAASKKYIPETSLFKDKLPGSKMAREEFTPDEYRRLHTFARSWIKLGRNATYVWYRTMAYNFVLIMCNTGMRPPEAKNLKWRDVSERSDKQGRKFVILNVRGKGKFRSLVATTNVAEYFSRIHAISNATGPDDAVFSDIKGQPARTLYDSLIRSLLTESNLRLSASGKYRSTYCFRHTYATFRLSEGVDSLFLARQMGTSVKMIEDHYGHITPVKNAERILQGMPGWVSAVEVPGASLEGVNARAPGSDDASDRP